MDEENLAAQRQIVDAAIADQPQIVQIDYRRRSDIIAAVITVMPEVWVKLDRLRRRRKELKSSKRSTVCGVLFLVSSIIAWLFDEVNLLKQAGYIGMWVSAGIYLIWQLDEWLCTREIAVVERVQSEYFFRWLAASGSSDLYWRWRDQECERAIVEEDVVSSFDAKRNLITNEAQLVSQWGAHTGIA